MSAVVPGGWASRMRVGVGNVWHSAGEGGCEVRMMSAGDFEGLGWRRSFGN